jgi:hypothetical protein
VRYWGIRENSFFRKKKRSAPYVPQIAVNAMPIYDMHLYPAETIVCIGSAWEGITVNIAELSIEPVSQLEPKTFFPDLAIYIYNCSFNSII